MSNGKARNSKTLVDNIIELKREQKKQYGLTRQRASGVVSTSSSGANRSGNTNTNITSGYLKTGGDTMMGPIAFYPRSLTVASDSIDISEATGTGFSSRVILLGQGGAADNLQTITGAKHAGQILFIQAVATTPITLKHGVDNIWLPTLADYTVTDKEIVMLQYDSINVKWSGVANFTAVGGGGGGLNTDLSNMTSPTAPPVDLDMNDKDILGVKHLDFDDITSSISGLVGLSFYHSPNAITSLGGSAGLYYATDTGGHTFTVLSAGSTLKFYGDKLEPGTNNIIDLGASGKQFKDLWIDGTANIDVLKVDISLGSDILPSPSNTYDLGSASFPFAEIHTQDLYVYDDIIMDGAGSNITNAGDVSTQTVTVSGLAVFNGAVSLGNSTGDLITVTGRIASNVIPTSAIYDLGASAIRWANIYGAKVDITGSSSTATALKINNSGGIVDFDGNAISLTATSGFATLPGNPVGFINVKVGGSNYRVPYYNT